MEWVYEDGRIYSTDENGDVLAETTYIKKTNGEVDIDHTFVHSSLRGQGIASKMMGVVAAYIRKEGWKATASCSYANMWLERNKEDYADIISDDLSQQVVACKLDGKR